MRYRLMATYRGVPYEAGIGPSETDVVLFAACPPPEELGFEPATGHWRKQLRIDEVQALWESKPTGRFRGERCVVLDDLGDRLHIAYLGHDAYQAEKLGYWQVDRGVFELITPRDEVLDIVEERTDYPGRAASGPPRGEEFSVAPLAAAAPPPAGPGPGSGPVPPPAAGRRDAASTKLADLAAATLAHLATMSHAPARDAVRDPRPVPNRDPARMANSDPARIPARDPGPDPVRPRTGLASETSNGFAPYPAEFPMPAGPRSWPGSAPGAGVAMPPPQEEPLPLEAAARRAATAATAAMRRERRTPAPRDQAPAAQAPAAQALAARAPADQAPADQAALDAAAPAAAPPDAAPPDAAPRASAPRAQAKRNLPLPDLVTQGQARPDQGPGDPAPEPAGPPRRRRTARKRVATQGIFSELASLAAIPPAAYAVGAEVDGAMCLIQAGPGFEVFNAVAGARHEVRSFQDEESAYFYLFGVLAADAVRTGRLVPGAS